MPLILDANWHFDVRRNGPPWAMWHTPCGQSQSACAIQKEHRCGVCGSEPPATLLVNAWFMRVWPKPPAEALSAVKSARLAPQ